MLRSRRSTKIELLEERLALSVTPLFEDSGQQLGTNSMGVPLGDLDGDGDLDAFVSCWSVGPWGGACDDIAVWLNDGQGNFSKGWSDPMIFATQVALGDLDGDNDLDAFIGMASAPGLGSPGQVWLNDGNGNFTDSGQRLRCRYSEARLGDLDGDGDLDAFAAGGEVFLNDGHGNFVDSGQRFGSGAWLAVALGDLDGDEDLDAYLQGPNLGQGRVYLNDGEGNFTDTGQQLGPGRGTVSTVQLGDLDNDGDLDAFVAYGDPRDGYLSNEAWLNDGQGNFTDSGQRLGSMISRWVELGDLDGDGDLDAFVANGTGNSGQPNRVWLNDGQGIFSQYPQDLGRSGSVSVSLGDLDGDGDLDALVGQLRLSSTTNVWNRVWINLGLPPGIPGDANLDGRVDAADLNILGLNWRGTDKTWAEGDFTRDGNVDAADLNELALNWRSGVAAQALAAKGAPENVGLPRVPRAPLAVADGAVTALVQKSVLANGNSRANSRSATVAFRQEGATAVDAAFNNSPSWEKHSVAYKSRFAGSITNDAVALIDVVLTQDENEWGIVIYEW